MFKNKEEVFEILKGIYKEIGGDPSTLRCIEGNDGNGWQMNYLTYTVVQTDGSFTRVGRKEIEDGNRVAIARDLSVWHQGASGD
jgi:hypothetical protein